MDATILTSGQNQETIAYIYNQAHYWNVSDFAPNCGKCTADDKVETAK